MNKVYYHVRHANGTTIHWLRNRRAAEATARTEGLQVYEVQGGVARRIF